MRRALQVVAPLAALALITAWLLLGRSGAGHAPGGDVDEAGKSSSIAVDALASPRAGAVATSAADSLRGTGVDGAITLDTAGKPVPDRAMRRMFDYFLTRLGERSIIDLRGDLARHLQGQLSAPALAQVLVWFNTYVALEQESAGLGAVGDLRTDLERRRELRRRRLGAVVAEAWYGEEERRLEASLARRELLHDHSLGAAQRAARMHALEARYGLPPDSSREESETVELARQQSALFAADGTAPEQRMVEREALFGRDAALRLAALDTRRAQWQLRLATYRTQRQQVFADRQLDAVQRRQRLQALLLGFDVNERRRVDALTRAGGGGGMR